MPKCCIPEVDEVATNMARPGMLGKPIDYEVIVEEYILSSEEGYQRASGAQDVLLASDDLHRWRNRVRSAPKRR